MQPFDDSIPEELEPPQAALVSMLRQASYAPVQLTGEEQAQLLERVQQRLQSPDSTGSAIDEQATRPAGAIGSMPPKKSAIRPFAIRQRRRIMQFASMLAAVLVVVVIISASLLLFAHRPQQVVTSQPQSVQFGPVGKVTIASEAGGFEMSMEITGAPYFLSELLRVDLSLTNHTDKTAYVDVPFVESPCGYATGVQVTGEDNPQFVISISTDHSCPPGGPDTAIKPGQTLTAVKYLPLTNSGHLTLTAETAFYSSASQSRGLLKQISSPLDGHWPTISINVASKVPADRTISYYRVGPRVFIDAPRPVEYLYSVYCSDTNNDGGGTGTGNFGWESLTKNVVGEPGCPGMNVQWRFAFGLPGYGIVQGNVTFPGNDPNP